MSVILWRKRTKDNHKQPNRDSDYKMNKLIYLIEKLLKKLG